jgi:hypothetical protein
MFEKIAHFPPADQSVASQHLDVGLAKSFGAEILSDRRDSDWCFSGLVTEPKACKSLEMINCRRGSHHDEYTSFGVSCKAFFWTSVT